MSDAVAQPAVDPSRELLERGDELSMLGDCMDAVQASRRGRLLLIGGEAGVGKSALLRRFCDEGARGARVLWVNRCLRRFL